MGQALIPATALFLLPIAMLLRSISLAWVSVAVLAFVGLVLVFSIGQLALVLAVVAAPAVWQYTRLARRHRTTEPIDPVKGHPSQP